MQKFQQIQEHFNNNLKQQHIKELLKDSIRCRNLLFETSNFLIDLSREKIDYYILDEFQKISDLYIRPKIEAMFKGEKINITEDREVLHFLLRNKEKLINANEKIQQVQSEVLEGLNKMENFSQKVRQGSYLNQEGNQFKDIVLIGIGGSSLGTLFLYEALKFNPEYKKKQSLNLHFLSNVDPIAFSQISKELNAKTTLVIIVSKSFTTSETIQNAELIKQWITDSYSNSTVDLQQIIQTQFLAVSSNKDLCFKFGIKEENIYPMWDEVGGRFSISSAVGGLPISLCFGFQVFDDFLNGMNDIDNIYHQNFNIKQNIPILLSLIDAFHNYTQKFNTKVIIPYAEALHKFSSHIQQVEMESIGKNYNISTNQFLNKDEWVAQFVFGEPGTNSQHSFFQSLHQGRPSPIEFIGYCKPQNDQMSINGVNCYNNFIANMFAQADAFALGEFNENKAEHFEGDRPSFIILFKDEINAYNLGILMSIYENRCASSGFLADINTFDQYGVNLGKKLANNILPYLKSKEQEKSSIPNVPSQYLIQYFNENAK